MKEKHIKFVCLFCNSPVYRLSKLVNLSNSICGKCNESPVGLSYCLKLKETISALPEKVSKLEQKQGKELLKDESNGKALPEIDRPLEKVPASFSKIQEYRNRLDKVEIISKGEPETTFYELWIRCSL